MWATSSHDVLVTHGNEIVHYGYHTEKTTPVSSPPLAWTNSRPLAGPERRGSSRTPCPGERASSLEKGSPAD